MRPVKAFLVTRLRPFAPLMSSETNAIPDGFAMSMCLCLVTLRDNTVQLMNGAIFNVSHYAGNR
jgi:hypothetical protein